MDWIDSFIKTKIPKWSGLDWSYDGSNWSQLADLRNWMPSRQMAGLSDRSRYRLGEFERGLPVIGPWLQSADSTDKAEDYLKNKGLDWGDIKYHSMSTGVSNAVNSTVSAISSLYTTAKPPSLAQQFKQYAEERAKKEFFEDMYEDVRPIYEKKYRNW